MKRISAYICAAVGTLCAAAAIIIAVGVGNKQAADWRAELTTLTMEIEREFRDSLPNQFAAAPFTQTPDYASARKKIKDALTRIQTGKGWRMLAAEGQLHTRDLILGILSKADVKELKRLWQKAADAYKQARILCETGTDALESQMCVDIVTKSYEFLVLPSEKGGLGALGDREEAQNTKGLSEIPLIRGAGSTNNIFGTK